MLSCLIHRQHGSIKHTCIVSEHTELPNTLKGKLAPSHETQETGYCVALQNNGVVKIEVSFHSVWMRIFHLGVGGGGGLLCLQQKADSYQELFPPYYCASLVDHDDSSK